MLHPQRPQIDLVKMRGLAGEERRAAHRTNLKRLMIHDPAPVDALALGIQVWNASCARFVSRGFALGDSLRQVVERLACPLSAMWGQFDQVAGPGGARARLDLLRAIRPDLREAVIPGAGHWVAYEAAEAFNAALAAVLAAGPAPRTPAATAAR